MIEELIRRILHDTTVFPESVHGPEHWACVERNGIYLSEFSGCDRTVVRLFAWLHDMKRMNDGTDPGHGLRAANYVRKLPLSVLGITTTRLEQLCFACQWHTAGAATDDPTVVTCWDADRLDLTRLGIRPDPGRLFTPEAKRLATSGDFSPLLTIPTRTVTW